MNESGAGFTKDLHVIHAVLLEEEGITDNNSNNGGPDNICLRGPIAVICQLDDLWTVDLKTKVTGQTVVTVDWHTLDQ